MRDILSISLPSTKIRQDLKKRAKKRGFSSVSQYVLALFEADADELISANNLLLAKEEALQEYNSGKIKKVKSLIDLYENK